MRQNSISKFINKTVKYIYSQVPLRNDNCEIALEILMFPINRSHVGNETDKIVQEKSIIKNVGKVIFNLAEPEFCSKSRGLIGTIIR